MHLEEDRRGNEFQIIQEKEDQQFRDLEKLSAVLESGVSKDRRSKARLVWTVETLKHHVRQ